MSLEKGDALCALGRFAIPQIMNSRKRLLRAKIMRNGEQVPAHAEEIAGKFAEILENAGGKILMVEHVGGFYESRKAVRALAAKFGAKIVKAAVNDASLDAETLREISEGKYEAAFTVGSYLAAELASLKRHCRTKRNSCFPSRFSGRARARLPTQAGRNSRRRQPSQRASTNAR